MESLVAILTIFFNKQSTEQKIAIILAHYFSHFFIRQKLNTKLDL